MFHWPATSPHGQAFSMYSVLTLAASFPSGSLIWSRTLASPGLARRLASKDITLLTEPPALGRPLTSFVIAEDVLRTTVVRAPTDHNDRQRPQRTSDRRGVALCTYDAPLSLNPSRQRDPAADDQSTGRSIIVPPWLHHIFPKRNLGPANQAALC
jgi:hypothetical protein